MELAVGRTVDPHTLAVTVRLFDPEIKAATDGADPDDLAFKLWMLPHESFGHAEYLRLVADLVEKAEQAAALNLGAAAGPEQK